MRASGLCIKTVSVHRRERVPGGSAVVRVGDGIRTRDVGRSAPLGTAPNEVLAGIAGRGRGPSFLVDLAHAVHRLGRSDDFRRATAAAYATPWFESARGIDDGDFVRAADVSRRDRVAPRRGIRAAPRGGGAAGRGSARRSGRAARACARVLPVGPCDALPRARGAAACLPRLSSALVPRTAGGLAAEAGSRVRSATRAPSRRARPGR